MVSCHEMMILMDGGPLHILNNILFVKYIINEVGETVCQRI